MKMINVVLVGTNNLFRQGLRRLLDPSQFAVAGEARDLHAFEAVLEDGLAPDLVVAELNRCHEADVDSLRGLAERAPNFANGSAANLMEVVDFYDRRFEMKLSDQDKQDLVNFMSAL